MALDGKIELVKLYNDGEIVARKSRGWRRSGAERRLHVVWLDLVYKGLSPCGPAAQSRPTNLVGSQRCEEKKHLGNGVLSQRTGLIM